MTFYSWMEPSRTGPKPQDITGYRFGKLTAIEIVSRGNGDGPVWLFNCDCGLACLATRSHLRDRRACPTCARREAGEARRKPPAEIGSLQWKWKRLAQIHYGMKRRCTNPNDSHFARYGGRGIELCDEWMERSKPFIEWALENGYEPGLSIDRIDCNGHYSPDNCRWADSKVQSRNRTNTILNPELAAIIRKRLAAGDKPKDIARDIGHPDKVHLVYNIKYNDAWGSSPRNYYSEINVRRGGGK